MDSIEEQLDHWMKSKEGQHLEFKEAKNNFSPDRLIKYCCALANERGGHIILGVTDHKPRTIVGTQAFLNLEKIKSDVISCLQLRIDVMELHVNKARVLIFQVPSRPIGVPIQYEGIYWMRRGEELVTMTQDMLKRIFEEGEPDFSAQICPKATFEDLDPNAIQQFRIRWQHKSGNGSLLTIPPEQLLLDADLINEKGITFAALILLGKRQSLTKFLPQAEVIFEYRSSDITGPAQQRIEYREGFFCFYDDLWEKINLRNDLQHFQDGLFIWDILTFNEKVIREAILNAISHRDYRLQGSVFIRQFSKRIEIDSPGGFPDGITPENILWKQLPRNRRIAEAFSKCGLIERAGQGANRIFEESIREGKPLPDFSRTDAHEVVLTLVGEIQDKCFLRFLEKVGQERLASFSTEDFLVLDLVHREQPIPPNLKARLPHLIDLGIVERVGKGKGVRYNLCQQYYELAKQSGVYTRKRGLDKETNKELLLKHIRSNKRKGSKLADLCQVLPALSRAQVQNLLRELKKQGKVELQGKTNRSLWFPSPMD